MQLLDECLELRQAIARLDEKIEEINAKLYTPKNQIISDMPRGRSVESATDKLLAKKERLVNRRRRHQRELKEKWKEIEPILFAADVTVEQAKLIRYRFYKGMQWKACARKMQAVCGDSWNENKVFREYRLTLSKLHNNNTQTA